MKAGTRVKIKSDYDYLDDFEGIFMNKRIELRIGNHRWHEWLVETNAGTIASGKICRIKKVQ